MSFTQQVKKEIAAREMTTPCCVAAACYGVACFAKYFDTKGIVLHTERAYIAQWAKALFAQAGIKGRVYVRGEHAQSYEFAVKEPFEAEKALVMFSHTGTETALRIQRENLECGQCFSCFLAAAFMCAGVAVDPEKGYTLEFVSGRYPLMRDFEALLAEHGFEPKRASRRGANVIYFKASEQIEDLLTLMGAGKSSLEIMNLKVYKDFRNRANRITNCETANIDKIVAANRNILHAIAYLEAQNALDTLPEPLRQAAALRRENPDLSLAELAALCPEPVSKSGLNHRYRRLTQLAEDLRARLAAKEGGKAPGSDTTQSTTPNAKQTAAAKTPQE